MAAARRRPAGIQAGGSVSVSALAEALPEAPFVAREGARVKRSAGRRDHLRRNHRRLDGGADALAAAVIGEPDRVAREDDPVPGRDPPRPPVQDVRVALELRGHAARDAAAIGEPVAERTHVLGDVAVFLAAEAHVEDVLLAEHPAVALEIRAKEDLRSLLRHRALRPLRLGHLELDLVGGHDRLRRADLRPEMARDRAEVSARPHDHRRLGDVVHPPQAVRALEPLDGMAGELLRPAAVEEVVVELDAADAVARHLAVAGLDHSSRHAAGPERPDRLEHPGRPVLVGVEPERLDRGRGDPPRAHLVAGEVALVDDRHLASCAP